MVQGDYCDKCKTINPKLSLSSPPYEQKERNSNERHQANGLFASWKLFRGIEELCADAGGIRMFFYGSRPAFSYYASRYQGIETKRSQGIGRKYCLRIGPRKSNTL